MEELDLNRVNLKIQFHEEEFSEKFISADFGKLITG